MRHLCWTLPILLLLCIPLAGQSDPHTALGDALAFDNLGSFETAAKMAKSAIDSGQLSSVELGKAYIVLGVSYSAGNLTEAQIAFEHALHILEHDHEHIQDYAWALESYAAFYAEMGQLDIAAPMWRKALQLRQKIGRHDETTVPLVHLAELALARNRVHEAQQYLKRADDEAKLATDISDNRKELFFETQGWLAEAMHDPSSAVVAYQKALELVERSHGAQHWVCGWEHMLLGKAYGQSGDLNGALAEMRKGLTIIEHSLGTKNPKYFIAEVGYSQLLDRAGLHAEAAQMREAAAKSRKDYYRGECSGCMINVSAFR